MSDTQPSAGYTELEELQGLLRVAHMQRDDHERQVIALRTRNEQLEAEIRAERDGWSRAATENAALRNALQKAVDAMGTGEVSIGLLRELQTIVNQKD